MEIRNSPIHLAPKFFILFEKHNFSKENIFYACLKESIFYPKKKFLYLPPKTLIFLPNEKFLLLTDFLDVFLIQPCYFPLANYGY